MAGKKLKVTNRELRSLLKHAENAGCTVTASAHHIRIDTPNGPVFAARTPSDHRAVKNIRAELRRKGVEI